MYIEHDEFQKRQKIDDVIVMNKVFDHQRLYDCSHCAFVIALIGY